MGEYHDFLARKSILAPLTGIENPPSMPDVMFPHQKDIVSWALRRGRAAVFAGTGLGKSLMELAWGDAVASFTGLPVLVFAPLAVAAQLVREADKFGMNATLCRSQDDVRQGINITNYQKIDHFDLSKFGGVILDESSILKNETGHYRNTLISRCQRIPFRLAATATPAPNDFMELGNHAEFLGIMSYTDMLATFFIHDGGDTAKWRLKGHAEEIFWKWMASWSVMLRRPSDLGYPNDGYDLPPLIQHQHTVGVEYKPSIETGLLFPLQAASMSERIGARRDSVKERVAMAFSVVMANLCDITAEYVDHEDLSCLDGSLSTKLTAAPRLIEIQNMLRSLKRQEAERLRKIAPICENTTKKIRKDGTEELKSREIDITLQDAKNTKTILNLPKDAKSLQEIQIHQNAEIPISVDHLALEVPNMTPCFPNKAEDAQSAGHYQATEIKDYALTTATTKDTSGGYCAELAIKGLVSSMTASTGLIEPLNICSKLGLRQWVVWCQLNKEQDLLEKEFGDLCISINGSHSEDEKEDMHLSWINGDAPILLVKPSMFGYGVNWQNCSDTIFVGLNDSFEQVYQSVRRFWRFGQTKTVNAHFIAAETEGAVVANLNRKEIDADRMADAMVRHMADLSSVNIRGASRDTMSYVPVQKMILPSFI